MADMALIFGYSRTAAIATAIAGYRGPGEHRTSTVRILIFFFCRSVHWEPVPRLVRDRPLIIDKSKSKSKNLTRTTERARRSSAAYRP